MGDDIVVKVEHVSKKFARSLKRAMVYGISDISRNALGMSSHPEKLREDEFWAANDVSFELRKGETLGLIGSNGSGKSTLLKMLNGIFWPDEGKITIKGRVGALIEVGAGFHPMLTGRENIYVNAAILGMTKKEVDEKFDDIIKFADIGDFLDTPVKFYSSGMYVRLGFAVAVHCEPDILLVDEVLAVGDLAFVLKCHRKMSEFRQKGGTVVIVSHNMQAIRNMCKKVLWIEKGEIKGFGEVYQICDMYEKDVIKNKNDFNEEGSRLSYDPDVDITKVEFLNKNNQNCTDFCVGDYFKIRIHFDCKRIVSNPIFTVSIINFEGQTVSSNYSNLDRDNLKEIAGVGYIDFHLDKLPFSPSKYVCSITFSEGEVSNILIWFEKTFTFTITGGSTNYGIINPFPTWTLKMINRDNM